MICDLCKKAAEEPADETGTGNVHPQNCGCPCQHRSPGAWKGTKETNAEARA